MNNIVRQKNESIYDQMQTIKFVLDIAGNRNCCMCSNGLDNPELIFESPDSIASQFEKVQKDVGVNEFTGGKREYSMIYQFDKMEDSVDVNGVFSMCEELMQKYPLYQAIAMVGENKEKINAYIIFNNYSCEGQKMSKDFRPYHISNIYNKYQRNKKC